MHFDKLSMKTDYALSLLTLLREHNIQQKDLAAAMGITAVAVHKALNSTTMTDTTYHRYREALLALIVERQHTLPDELEINGVKYKKVRE